ncbi:MAG: ABC transporter permease [Halanaerobiales bacterium]
MKIFTSNHSKIKNRLVNFLLSTTFFMVVLIIWGIMAERFNPLLLPSPVRVGKALLDLMYSPEFYRHLTVTLKRTLFGYGGAVGMGILTALLLSTSSFWQRVIRPVITVIQATPPIIWLALAVIWFGIAEDLTPIFLIFMVTFPIIFVNIFAGIQDIDIKLVEMARLYRCSRKKIIWEIYLPALFPHLISALSIGFAFAWKSTVFAECLGSSSGVGYALSVANSNLATDYLFAWAIILISFMLIVEYLILKPLQKKVTRWKKDDSSA